MFFQTINVIAAIFLAKVRRAIRGLPSLGEQILVEIVKRSTIAADSRCCSFKNIFEVVVVVPI